MSRHPTQPIRAREASHEGSSDRTFGLVFAGFFLVVGVWPWLRGGDPRWWAMMAAALCALLALAWPRVLAWPNRAWTRLGLLLHRITSPVALALIYFLGIVPSGLLMRVLGKDPLRLRPRPDLETYWIERNPPARADERMKRQF